MRWLLPLTIHLVLVSVISACVSVAPRKLVFAHETEYLRLDARCVERATTPAAYVFAMREATDEGFACLERLGTPTSLRILDEVRVILANRKAEILCAPDSGVREGTHAYVESYQPLDGAPLRMHLNVPSIDEYERRRRGALAGVIFHELLHAPGYSHHRDIEYPYACEHHCFGHLDPPTAYAKEAFQAARDICSGVYQDRESMEYLRTAHNLALLWERDLNYRLEMVISYLKRNPSSRYAWFLLARTLRASQAWPVGAELTSLLATEAGSKANLNRHEQRYVAEFRAQVKRYPSRVSLAARHLGKALYHLKRAEFWQARDALASYNAADLPAPIDAGQGDRQARDYEIVRNLVERFLRYEREWLEQGAPQLGEPST